MAAILEGTGQKLGGAFVQIRAALAPLRAGLAAARSMVSVSIRGITKLAAIPITISIKAIRGAMSAAVAVVKSAMHRIRQLMFISGIGGGALLWGFAGFEKSMREATAVSETTAEQFKLMSEMARGQAMRLNKSASELAQGFYFLGSAGLSAADQIKAFPAVATLAKAAVIDMGAAAEMVVDTMKGFGIAFENTTHVTDVMAKAVISSNMTFAQLGTALSYVSGVARMANNTLEETTAAIAQMADVGIKGTRAGVYMRTGLLRLMAPMSEARKELERFGVSIYDEAGKMKPFIQIVGELGGALKGASEEQRNMAFKALFGQRAITGQIAIFRQGRAELERFTNMLRAAGGTAERVAMKQLNSLAQQFGKLLKIITDTAYDIGKALGPALREAVADLQVQFKKLNEFFKKHELVIAKYALQGYRYLKAFGSGVIDIVRDISENWDKRWAFMVQVVGIQVKAARDIIAATFDDVWATLKEGAIAYGKTIYEVFKKVFTDIARNMKGWIAGGMAEWKEYGKIYSKFLDEQQRMFEAEGIRTHKAGGYETEEYKAAKRYAREKAREEFEKQKALGAYKHLHPEKIEGEPWADVGKRIKEHWLAPLENAKERVGGILNDIVEIEKKAATEIGAAVPEAWKNRWADLKDELAEIDKDMAEWYAEQKNAADKAVGEIEKLTKARDELTGGAGGKIETKEEKKEERRVAFVGIKEAWRQIVQSIYSPQTKLMSEQADLLGDIDEGQNEIVAAVDGVRDAITEKQVGITVEAPKITIPEIPAAKTKPGDTGFGKYIAEKTQKFRDYIEGVLGRRAPRREQFVAEQPEEKEGALAKRREGRKKREREKSVETAERRAIREEIRVRKEKRESEELFWKHRREYPEWKPAQEPEPTIAAEKPVPPKLKPKEYRQVPEWPKPVSVGAPLIEVPEISILEAGPIRVEKPESLAVEAPKIPPVGVEMPKMGPVGVETPKLGPLGLTVPPIPPVGVETPKIPPVGVETPRIPPVGVKAPKITVPNIGVEAPRIDVPRINVPKVETPKIEPLKIEINAPKIEVPKIDAPVIKSPVIEAPRVDMPRLAMPEPSLPTVPPERQAAPRADQSVLKEIRTAIDVLQRIRSGINKLAPIGATVP